MNKGFFHIQDHTVLSEIERYTLELELEDCKDLGDLLMVTTQHLKSQWYRDCRICNQRILN